MPLMKKASKKAFEHNIKTEMRANPSPEDRKQNIAIAYSVQRQAKKKHKKMAEGGVISAKSEKRPMPSETDNDSKNVSQNSGKKPLLESGWTDQPTLAQARNPGMKGTKIKHPKMVKSDVLQVRLRDEEDDLQSSAGTNEGPQRQPPEHDNEEGPNRQGRSPEKQTSISTGKQVMAKGGKVERSDYDDTDPNAATDSDMHLTPSEDEAEEMARHHNEEYQRQTSGNPDMSKPHNPDQSEPYSDEEDSEDPATNERRMAAAFANGGYAEHIEDDQPEPEAEDEEHDSIAAAVMARRERAKAEIDSGNHDMDLAARYAQGGEITEERGNILSEGAMDSDDSDQVDLRRNAEEDQNQEDQASFRALEKENYSESDGLEDLTYDTDRSTGDEEEDNTSNPHDMVDSIRRKMKSKRSFSDN